MSPKEASAVEEKIRAIAEGARIVRTTRAQIPLPLIIGSGPAYGDRLPHEHSHEHIAADGFKAVSFASDQAFSADAFQAFLEHLPANVFRAKGVLTIDGGDRRHLFHLVGRRFTLDTAPLDLTGPNRLVLIGKNLNAARLRAQLAACLTARVIPAPE